jgi:hypothetical protein
MAGWIRVPQADLCVGQVIVTEVVVEVDDVDH